MPKTRACAVIEHDSQNDDAPEIEYRDDERPRPPPDKQSDETYISDSSYHSSAGDAASDADDFGRSVEDGWYYPD